MSCRLFGLFPQLKASSQQPHTIYAITHRKKYDQHSLLLRRGNTYYFLSTSFFLRFSPVGSLFCLTIHINTLIFNGSLLLHSLVILLFITPLNFSLLYIDLVVYWHDFSSTQPNSASPFSIFWFFYNIHQPLPISYLHTPYGSSHPTHHPSSNPPPDIAYYHKFQTDLEIPVLAESS